MSLAGLALAQLLTSCAPAVGPRTMSSIVAVESGGDPLAIHDNDDGRSYRPASPQAAVSLASSLIARGHSVDLGLAQINSANVQRLGLTVQTIFDPCANLRTGAQILSADYARASARYGPGQRALLRAIGAYNTGQLTEGDGYISAVVGAARRIAADPLVIALRIHGRVGPVALRSSSAPGKRNTTHAAFERAQDAPILVPLQRAPSGRDVVVTLE